VAIRTVPIKLGPFLQVPVAIESAVEAEVSMSNVCTGTEEEPHAPSKTRQSLACQHCGGTGPFKKGREVDGTLRVVTPEELAEAEVAAEIKDAITLLPRTGVAERVIAGEKVYYLKPGKGGQAGYGLLLAAIKQNRDRSFCAVFALRGKPRMFCVGVFGDVLTLQTVCWPEDLKLAPSVPTDYDETHLPLVQQIIDGLTEEFDPTTFVDQHRAEVNALLASKAGTVPFQPLPANVPANVDTSLLAALQASVEALTPAPAKAPRKRAPRKAAVAKKESA
jgi:DNA end-binding protein Ku